MANEIQFPTSPTNGNIYSMGGRNYRYDSAQDKFVAVATATIVEGGGVTIYATIDDLPLSGNTQGDLAHVTANNTLYFWNGSGWYKIALINNSPSISNVNSSYTLSDIGADTVITMVAEDPEGLAITYSIASDTSGNTATVVQGTGANTNIFTITPSTDANDNGTFSLTFRASDGVNIATAPASFTLNILVTVENSNYTTALITSVGTNNQVNNDFVDSSTNSHTVTAAGNATQSTFSPYRHGGYSTYFDGSGDYLTGPSIVLSNSTAFTIEMWYYNTSSGTGEEALICQRNGASSPWNGWRIYNNQGSADTLSFYNGTAYVTIATNLPRNQWHHIAVVSQGSGTNQGQCYLNGVASGSAFTVDSLINFNGNLAIGTDNAVTSRTMTGYLADVRVVNGTAVYTSNFTPPTERLTAITNTSLLTCHLPYIADGSNNAHSITVNGNTKTEPFAPFDYEAYSASTYGGSMYFDGTGDRLTFSHASDFSFGTDDFTIEFWIKTPTNAITSGYSRTICEIGQLHVYMRITAYHGGVDSAIRVWDETADNDIGNVAIADDLWHHVAIVRESGTMKCWVDGKYNTGVSNSRNLSETGTNAIGGRTDGNGHMEGTVADLRVVKGTAVYTGTSNFTPPTAPLTAITNTSLLLSGTNAGIIDKSQSIQTMTLNGDVKSSTTQSKYLTSSMYFDGASDMIQIDGNESLDNYAGDFTIELWFYPLSAGPSSFGYLYFQATSSTPYSPILLCQSQGSYGFVYFASSTQSSWNLASNKTIGTGNANAWNHIAVVRDGTDIKAFMNGTLGSTTSVGTTALCAATSTYSWLGGGNSNNTYINGYMSDFRLTKGLARYTANFTPPTAALQG